MDEVAEIKSRVDLVDFISEYIQLKKAGANWKAPCPFHHEKTPSFMVSREKQIWHCFGCSSGGDLFSFLQKIEGLEFPEALKLLADRCGVKLESRRAEIGGSIKNRLIEINTLAAAWFHKGFTESPKSEEAREYMKKRGVSDEMVSAFQIGFAPDEWDLLTRFMLKRGYGIDDLMSAGLTSKSDSPTAQNRMFDRFRDRIMFPIRNVQGQVVGFTGRLLHEREGAGGKYVNSPQSQVFDKGAMLYGLDRARQEARQKDFLVIVEGQMDVIACHQIGMSNVVAASGTALTERQVALIKRYTTNIRVAFDEDAAGVSAAKRGMDIALSQGLNVKAILMPQSGWPAGTTPPKDPDECIKRDSNLWNQAVDSAVDLMEFYFSAVLKDLDLKNPSAKQAVADEILTQIAKIESPILQDHWVQELSSRLKIGIAAMREALQSKTAQKSKIARRLTGRNVEPARQGTQKEAQKDLDAEASLRYLVLAYKYPQFLSAFILKSPAALKEPYSAIYSILQKYYNIIENRVGQDKALFFEFVQKNADPGVDEKGRIYNEACKLDFLSQEESQNEADIEGEFRKLTRFLNDRHVRQMRDVLTEELKDAEKSADKIRMKKIVEELQLLLR